MRVSETLIWKLTDEPELSFLRVLMDKDSRLRALVPDYSREIQLRYEKQTSKSARSWRRGGSSGRAKTAAVFGRGACSRCCML